MKDIFDVNEFIDYISEEVAEEWGNDDNAEQQERRRRRWEETKRRARCRVAQEREEQRKVLNMLVCDALSDEMFCKLLENRKSDLREYIAARERGEMSLINDSLFFEERDKRIVVIMKKCEVKTAKGKKYRVIGFDLFTGTVVLIADTNGLAEGLHGYTQEMHDVQEMSIIMAPFVLYKSDKVMNVFRICGQMEVIGKTVINDMRNTYAHDYSWNIMSSFDAVEEFCKERKENSIAVLVNVKMGKIQKYHNRYQMKLNRLYVNLQDGVERRCEDAYFHGMALLWISSGLTSVLSLYGTEGTKEEVLKDRERIQNNLNQQKIKKIRDDAFWAEEERISNERYNSYLEELRQEEIMERQEYSYYNPDADEYYDIETGEVFDDMAWEDDEEFELADERYKAKSEKKYVLKQGMLCEQYPDEYDVFCNGGDVWGVPVSMYEMFEVYGSYDYPKISDGEMFERFFLWRRYDFPILNRVDRVEHIMNLICKINKNFICGRIKLDFLEPNASTDSEYDYLYRSFHIGTRAAYYDNLYDENGYGLDGYHLLGRDKTGYDRGGYNQGGYDRDGFNREGYDFWGFNREGINQYGFDRRGRLENGDEYDEAGYNAKGFNREGIHRNGTRYDARGYDVKGLDENGSREYGGSSAYGYDGYSKFGYDRKGYDRAGYDRYGRKRGGIKGSV